MGFSGHYCNAAKCDTWLLKLIYCCGTLLCSKFESEHLNLRLGWKKSAIISIFCRTQRILMKLHRAIKVKWNWRLIWTWAVWDASGASFSLSVYFSLVFSFVLNSSNAPLSLCSRAYREVFDLIYVKNKILTSTILGKLWRWLMDLHWFYVDFILYCIFFTETRSIQYSMLNSR